MYDKNKSGDIDNQEMAKLMQEMPQTERWYCGRCRGTSMANQAVHSCE